MKPFDLERALLGDPIVDLRGNDIVEICLLKKADEDLCVVAVDSEGTAWLYSKSGEGEIQYPNKLFMKEENKENKENKTYYVNVYKYPNEKPSTGFLYYSKEEADKEIENWRSLGVKGEFCKTISFEIEE